jgi:RHS repeat-associated protein
MVIQSSYYDPVMGLDTHIVGIPAPPAPAPVPTPIPMPFVGMVFDPAGLAMGAAIGMAMSGSPGLVMVNSMPATHCGTEATNKLTMPHIPAPGVMFIPPPMPSNDAQLFFGSLSISLGGSLGVRLGDIALSCNDPVRLPTSVVLAVPKGMPVLNLKPPVPDLAAIAMAAVMHGATRALGALARRAGAAFRRFRASSAFFRRMSQRLGGCMPPAGASRARQAYHRAVRTVTGHPVDVVTGNLFTDVIDTELPGPIPLVFERVYESCASSRKTGLGHGWNHSYDESLWMERGRAVVRLGDDREVEFPLWNLPDRRMRVGDSIDRVIHKMRLTCTGPGKYEIFFWDKQLVHEYAPVEGGSRDVAKLVKVKSRDGLHAIELYHRRGLLDSIRDSGGRIVELERDGEGRLRALKLPLPHGRGWYKHREYAYDRAGNLVEVRDAAGARWRYEYVGHLLVRETDRAGLSFYFQYDGTGELAKCVRTWGDGGIYDHEIHYDPKGRKTVVEDSLGAVTLYEFNERGRITKVTDPVGGVTEYEDDPDTGGIALIRDALGHETRYEHDALGCLRRRIEATGATTELEYDDLLLTRATDARGGRWAWRYEQGRLVERVLPTGDRLRWIWQRGRLIAIEPTPGRVVSFEHDDMHNVVSITLPTGAQHRYAFDNLGRATKVVSPRGGVSRAVYDPEGRLLEVQSPTGAIQSLEYDVEGNLVRARDATKDVRLGYSGRNRATRREDASGVTRYDYDSEGRLHRVTNGLGERYVFERDGAGNVVREVDFGGTARTYLRDLRGQITRMLTDGGSATSLRYDALGQCIERTHSDGSFVRFEHDAAGALLAAENESGRIEYARDELGRTLCERSGTMEVRSSYGLGGERTELTSSLGARLLVTRDALGGALSLTLGAPDGFKRQADVLFEDDAMGERLRARFWNGVEVRWNRDDVGRPLRRTTSVQRSIATPALELDALAYDWMGEDRISSIRSAWSGPRTFAYDGAGRVSAESGSRGALPRTFDVAGNVIEGSSRRRRDLAPGGRTVRDGEVLYEYDEEGRRTRRTTPGDTSDLRWNGHGLLSEVRKSSGEVIHYEYDAFGRRIRKRVALGDTTLRESAFVWDGPHLIHELDSDRGLTTWYFEPESFRPIVQERAGSRWAVVTDHLGTPTELYDDLGALAWRMQLDIHGVASLDTTSTDCPWRWPGQYADQETGLHYNRFRYYDPGLGNYLSPDPISLSGGLALYSYCGDPLGFIDPFGLQGGGYGIVRSSATASGMGGQVNHMPAYASYSGLTGSGIPTHYTGPSIWMTTADHMQTASWGSSSTASAHRLAQQNHILSGRFDLAMEMDIRDIQHNIGSHYDASITQMLDDAVARGYLTPAQRAGLRARRGC